MKILSRANLRETTRLNPQQHAAIIIATKNTDLDDIIQNCKDSLVLRFNDTTNDTRPDAPTKDDVLEALNWQYPDLIACQQGVSRSSAMAYLIEYKHKGEYAASVLIDPQRHYPNELIIWLGLGILGIKNVEPIKDIYKKIAEFRHLPVQYITKYFRD